MIDLFYCWLGDGCDGERPPGSEQRLRFGEDEEEGTGPHVAVTDVNDGFELWLGTMNKWHVFYSASEARKLAFFILWTWWVKGTWCGLKRWAWYKLLHIKVKRMAVYD